MANLAPFIKVLFLEANPETQTHLRINKEIREIKKTLRGAKHHDRIEINQLGAVRVEDFTSELLEYRPRIVHFSGHGEKSEQSENFYRSNPKGGSTRASSKTSKDRRKVSNKTITEGGLVFEDEVFVEPENEDEKNLNITKIVHRIVPPVEIAGFFEDLDFPVECVVLNGCHTQETAEEIKKHVRYVIGMGDKIPDEDAVNFSKYFYQALGGGSSIRSAFEAAKKRISDPSLPIWSENEEIRPVPYYEPRWIIASSLVSAFLVILFRIFGGLQGFEIAFYDHLQSSWSREKDERILVVQATNEDVRDQQQQGEQVIGSFSNETLANLLEEINSLQPAVIGLDIYRENALDSAIPEEQKLQSLFNQENVFGVCKLPEVKEGGQNLAPLTISQSVPPPPDISERRIGFSDVSIDQDTVVRRQSLGGFTDQIRGRKDCNAEEAFSLKLANSYLETQKKQTITLDNIGNHCQIKLPNGKTLSSLLPFTGGYQGDTRVDGGCQVLLKYRVNDDTWQSAEMFTVQQVLDGELEGRNLRDTIVLIGITRTDGYREYWNTPYNLRMGSQMAGVMIQAQMVSQLLDAALGESPLIWVLPFWGEWLWILLWSSVGGIIIWRLQLAPTRIGALVISIGASYAICYIVFQAFYGWLPFVPVVLVLVAAPLSNWLVDSGRLSLYKMRKKK
jgi:CHASE2 domain-containing sensor protein